MYAGEYTNNLQVHRFYVTDFDYNHLAGRELSSENESY